MKLNSILHHPASREDARSGVALVISLTLMAFIMLLLIAVSGMVSIETKVSLQDQKNLRSEQNAILGLQMSLGAVQSSLGPDRRISATAEILTEDQPHKRRNAVAVTQDHWTGAWNSDGGLRNWLVSGNEGTAIPALAYEDANPRFKPDALISNLIANPDAQREVRAGNNDALILVGGGSAQGTDIDSMVVAPLVELGGSGGYAWWVGDEGLKARINLVDSYLEDGDIKNPARFLTSQRNAMELMQGFESYPVAASKVGSLRKLYEEKQIQLAAASISDTDLKSHFHDITPSSNGLLTDTRNGGLKRDLTYLFELNESDFLSELPDLYKDANATLVKDSSGTTPIAQMAVTTPNWYFDANPQLDPSYFQPWTLSNLPFGATWEQLRSFYRLKDEVSGNTIAVRPQRENTSGLYPILLQMRLFSGISRTMEDNGGDATAGTDDDNMQVHAHFRLMFVLANPYTVDLDISDMNFTIYMRGGELQAARQDRTVFSEDFGKWREILNQQRYHIASGTIPAGQAQVFTLDRSGASFADVGLSYPYFQIQAHTASTNPPLVTHELINDFDQDVTLRCTLPGGPYTRAETNNIYLRSGGYVDPADTDSLKNLGGSDSTVITWSGNPSDYRDVLQFSGSTSGLRDQDHYEPDSDYQYSYPIDATVFDGEIAWGGGSRWLQTDVSLYNLGGSEGHVFNDYTRESNMRAPYRNTNSSPYRPGQGNNGGQRLSVFTGGSGSTAEPRFGAEELLHFINDTRVGWGMIYAPLEGQDPHGENRWFYVPTSSEPVNSLGQLQHFNASAYFPKEPASRVYNIAYDWARNYYNTMFNLAQTGVGYDDFPTLAFSHDYAIGNSFASRYVARDRIYQGGDIRMPRDASWLLNAALWDRFYFSSMPPSGTFDLSTDKLINNRYQPVEGEDSPLTAEALRDSATAFAQKMGSEGGFNVNSTSVEAWKAFLAGTLEVNYRGKANADEAVFPRTPRQDTNPTADGNPEEPLTANAWKGYRPLTLAEIDTLAQEIVRQVKFRGPFLSLEHFVNRLPVDPTDDPNGIGIRGALQAAIHEADLNPLAPPDEDPRFNAMHFRKSTTDAQKNKTELDIVDLDHGFPTMISGGPGQITQGDLLQPLGPHLSARSDTFRIRSSGVHDDPLTGEVVSQAWCEAVVQRLPEFVDDAQTADTSLTNLNANNQQFGRRFKVVSFRWLDKSEI